MRKSPSTLAPTAEPGHWDQRYRQGADGWELGRPAPPLERFLRGHPLAPRPPGTVLVLVPGCDHETALFDQQDLEAVGLTPGSLSGIVEHTCFCAIDPARRDDYIATVCRLLAPGGWLLGLFWCHPRPGGPPWGSDPQAVAAQLGRAGLVAEVWEPATGSVDQRQDEWLGLWRLSSPTL